MRSEGHEGVSHRQGKASPCRQRDCQKASLKGGDEIGAFGERRGNQCNRTWGVRWGVDPGPVRFSSPRARGVDFVTHEMGSHCGLRVGMRCFMFSKVYSLWLLQANANWGTWMGRARSARRPQLSSGGSFGSLNKEGSTGNERSENGV